MILLLGGVPAIGQSDYLARIKKAAVLVPDKAVHADSVLSVILEEVRALQPPNDSLLVLTCFILGKNNLYQGKLNLALNYFDKSLFHNQRNIIPKENMSCLANKAVIYQNQYRFNEALRAFEQALVYAEQSRDSSAIVDLWLNLGVISQRMNDIDRAVEILDNVYNFYQSRRDTMRIANVLNNIATCYYPNNLPAAEKNLKKSLELSRQIHKDYYVTLTSNNLAEVETRQKNYAEARLLLKENISLCEQKGYLEALSVAHRLVGLCEIESGGNLGTAASSLEKSRELALKTGRTDYQRDIREAEILLQARTGNFEGVKKMLEAYKILNDESAQKNARIVNAEFQTIHEVKQITQQKNVLQEGITLKNRQLLLSLFALLLATLAVGIIAFQYVRIKRAMKTMYRMNLEIANSALIPGEGIISFDDQPPVEQPDDDENQSENKGIFLTNLYAEIVRRIGNGKLYLDPMFSQQNLCDNMNRSQRYVSLALSEVGKISFPNLVNNFRINEARRLIADNPDITVIELMEKTGFGSRQSFNRHFKVATGFTPSEYQQRAREAQNQSLQ
ncbi:MAG: AraC family transcriptional regulator [Saprospiraceae bacterium]|nr:AraC family transcriptional regulator [Saprospiraceae bacterium]